jgi:hypothetical protein
MADDLSVSRPLASPPPDDRGRRAPGRGKRRAAPARPGAEPAPTDDPPPPEAPAERRLDLLV